MSKTSKRGRNLSLKELRCRVESPTRWLVEPTSAIRRHARPTAGVPCREAGQGAIREAIVEDDLVDCVVALPGNSSLRHRFRYACGSSTATRAPRASATAAASCSSSMHGSLEAELKRRGIEMGNSRGDVLRPRPCVGVRPTRVLLCGVAEPGPAARRLVAGGSRLALRPERGPSSRRGHRDRLAVSLEVRKLPFEQCQ
jgi:hypothetical protein